MNGETFHGLADECFNLHPERILFYDTGNKRSFSYAEGSELILKTSKYLLSQGFSKGDIIISYAPLCIESVMLCWASLYAGLVFVPVDYNWPEDLLAHIIEETDPGLILIDSERIHTFNVNRSKCSVVLTGKNKPDNYPALLECIENSPSQPINRPVISPADLAVILYTSGSTGIPKGVMLSHQALFKSGSLFAIHFGWRPDDVFMNLGDLHTLGGIKNTCFAPLHAGASFVIAAEEERKSILMTIDLISERKINYLAVGPTIIRQLNILHTGTRKDKLSSLKAIISAGAYLAHDQLRAFYSNYNIPVLNLYGSTETTGLCTGHNLSTFNPDDNSIGPATGAQLIIEPDPSYGNDINTGELLVKSDKLMSGYYKREAETNLVLKDGIFHTGDIVKKREDGFFEILGRKRNIVKTLHTELIHLEEIDCALESFPHIKEACSCSFSQSEEDEKIVAMLVLNHSDRLTIDETIAELKTHLLNKLGKNRMPWCYYIEESLPRNTAGKYQRQLIKDKLNEHIQSHSKRYF